MAGEKLEDRILRRIASPENAVFMRTDFSDMGSYDQVGRALRGLVREELLVKIGQGLYARARRSALDGKLRPERGLDTLKEALRRLGVEIVPTCAERAYNSGRSEQVPTGRVVGVRGKRIRRKIGYDGMFLGFERADPEREERRPKASRRSAAPITMREALRLLWEADHYPILGNEDWRASATLEQEARIRAATAKPSPDDPPEFGPWLAALLDESVPECDREAVMSALYELFDPDAA